MKAPPIKTRLASSSPGGWDIWFARKTEKEKRITTGGRAGFTEVRVCGMMADHVATDLRMTVDCLNKKGVFRAEHTL